MSDRDSLRTAISELSCSPRPDIKRSTICCCRASSSSIRLPFRYSWLRARRDGDGILHLAIERREQGVGLVEVSRHGGPGRRCKVTLQVGLIRLGLRHRRAEALGFARPGRRVAVAERPGLLDLFDRELGFLDRSLRFRQLRVGRIGIAVAKGREYFGLRCLALRKCRVGVAPALDELEPLGPMGRHLPSDRLERHLDLLGIREQRGDPLDPRQQSVGLPSKLLPARSVFPSGRRSSGHRPGWSRR